MLAGLLVGGGVDPILAERAATDQQRNEMDHDRRGVPAGLFLVDRILLQLEERDWIFYRRNKPNFQNAGSMFMELQAMFEPKARYVIERKEQEEHEEDED